VRPGSVRTSASRPPAARRPGSIGRLAAIWTLASTADSYLLLVVLWLAAPEHWTNVRLAGVILVIRLPVLLGGLLGGGVVDRLGPRRVLRIQLLASTVAMAALAAVSWAGPVSLPAILVLGALTAALMPMTYSATRVLVPEVVAPARLGRANAVMSVGDQLPAVVSAAVAGPAITVLGAGRALLLPAVLLLAATALAAPLVRPARSDDARDHADGTRPALVPSQPALSAGSPPAIPRRVWLLVGLSVVYYFCYSPLEPALPGLVRDHLHGNANAYGLLWTCFGLGSLAALALAPYLSRFRPGLVNGAGALVWGLVTLPLAMLHQTTTAAGLMVLSGVVWGPYTAVETTAIHRWTDPRRHGQLFGAQRALLSSVSPLGAAAGALLLDRISAGAVTVLATGSCALAGVVALASPALRNAR
jgi:predicted MFS family arabinose efflux permease